MNDYDKLFNLLKVHYKNTDDPARYAYVYLATVGRRYIPEDMMIYHINAVEKDIIMDALKA